MKQIETLITMVAFVLEQYQLFIKDEITGEQFRNRVWNFANFLSQTPKLGHFIPCDVFDVPLVEPDQNDSKYDIWISNDEVDCDYRLYDDDCIEYQQAVDRILFADFRIIPCNSLREETVTCVYNGTKKVFFPILRNLKIEDLARYNLKLTQTNKNLIYDGK